MEAEAEGEDRDERRGRGRRGEAKGRAGKRSGEKVKQGPGADGEGGSGDAPFRVLVRRAHHLREVDNHWLAAVPPDEDVELVKVPVDEPRAREAHDEVHERRVQLAGRREVVHLPAVAYVRTAQKDAEGGAHSG